jgi:hypothetical protein
MLVIRHDPSSEQLINAMRYVVDLIDFFDPLKPPK